MSAEEKGITAQPPKPMDLTTYENRAFDAYTQALADGKYTLLLFSKHHHVNGFAKTMHQRLEDPELAIYSAYFVAALVDEARDEGGEKLAKALDIQRYPTVIVLKTHMDKLHVVGRIEGVFNTDDIDSVLRESLMDPNVKEKREES
ncbi:MAG: hypothetical protein KDB27_16350 [Planctomycetales bacterium]|nr:hypothetical protein [Planctomycetales bacterium]